MTNINILALALLAFSTGGANICFIMLYYVTFLLLILSTEKLWGNV